jgi:hypothetical protein
MVLGLLVHCKTEVPKRTERHYSNLALLILFAVLKQPTGQSSISTYTWNNQDLATMVLARETIEFKTCDGTMLRGWFYPQVEKSGCVIMTHGVRTSWRY